MARSQMIVPVIMLIGLGMGLFIMVLLNLSGSQTEEIAELNLKLRHQRTFMHQQDQQLAAIFNGLHDISKDHQQALTLHERETVTHTNKGDEIQSLLARMDQRIAEVKKREAELRQGKAAFEQTRLEFRRLLEAKEMEIKQLRTRIAQQDDQIETLTDDLENSRTANEQLSETLLAKNEIIQEQQDEMNYLKNTMDCYCAVLSRDEIRQLKKVGYLRRRKVGFSSGYYEPDVKLLMRDRFLEQFQKVPCDETMIEVRSMRKPKLISVHKSLENLTWRNMGGRIWRLEGFHPKAFWRNQPHLIIEHDPVAMDAQTR